MLPYERIIQNPNLPENNVTAVIIGKKYISDCEALNEYGIRIITPDFINILPVYISEHPDMNIFHFGNKKIFLVNKAAGESLSDFECNFISETQGSEYPNDCLFNCVRIGNKFICNEKTVSKDILNCAYDSGLQIINVKQGYTKCSVCVIDSNSIITDDESIYKSASDYFDDILLIGKGSIKLETKEYGFIGGATGKIGKNILAFNGRIESHTDHNKIFDFLNKHCITAIELNTGVLKDIGSIIPVFEKTSRIANTARDLQ